MVGDSVLASRIMSTRLRFHIPSSRGSLSLLIYGGRSPALPCALPAPVLSPLGLSSLGLSKLGLRDLPRPPFDLLPAPPLGLLLLPLFTKKPSSRCTSTSSLFWSLMGSSGACRISPSSLFACAPRLMVRTTTRVRQEYHILGILERLVVRCSCCMIECLPFNRSLSYALAPLVGSAFMCIPCERSKLAAVCDGVGV